MKAQFADKKRSIIVVEDDYPTNKLYQYFLKQAYDGTILSASDGVEALYKCEIYQPELVFMDIQMPVKNGLDTIAELRRRGFSNPIVIITSNSIHNGEYKSLKVNMILQKPINQHDIIKQLELINKTDPQPTKILADRRPVSLAAGQ